MFWFSARKDEAMLYDLRQARLDFGWLDPVDTAQRLVNMAPAKKKGIALIELGQVREFDILSLVNSTFLLLHLSAALLISIQVPPDSFILSFNSVDHLSFSI